MDGNAANLDWAPFEIAGAERKSRWLVICDHASNVVPPWIKGGDLGLPAADMARHIAWDVGAAGVAREIADQLGAPLVKSNFSRLVIDPNRGEDDPTLVMQLYDGSLIPANRHISDVAVLERLNQCYRPYHAAIAKLAARQSDTAIVSIHSFTPQLKGRAKRPWHVGLLHATDTRLTVPLLDLLHTEGDIVVAANEPYTGFLKGDTIDRHAIATGRQNTLIEVRNDLIETVDQQRTWGQRLAGLLPKALATAETED